MAICKKCGSEYSALLLENCPNCKDRTIGEKIEDVAKDINTTIDKTIKIIFERDEIMNVGDEVTIIRTGMRHSGQIAEVVKIMDPQGWPIIVRFQDGKEIPYHPDELEIKRGE